MRKQHIPLLLGIVILTLFLTAALFPTAFTAYGQKEAFGPWLVPSAEHLLGTNALGYDIFTELVYGTRQTLLVGVSSSILTLLLGTGIRVSECVGLNLEDVDFNNGAIRIIRKGGNEALIYFGDEVSQALEAYMNGPRKAAEPAAGHEEALFISLNKTRITTRSVERLVKKYSRLVTTVKKITPHKLRSTFGSALYQETGDIYLVADTLGHKDVNTTKKHYAAIDEHRRRMAANVVKLRES